MITAGTWVNGLAGAAGVTRIKGGEIILVTADFFRTGTGTGGMAAGCFAVAGGGIGAEGTGDGAGGVTTAEGLPDIL